MEDAPIDVTCRLCGAHLTRSGGDEPRDDDMVQCPNHGPVGRLDEVMASIGHILPRDVQG